MPPLSARKRAALPNSAFAYIDSQGQRRLPINDEAHVRNALGRFSQVAFEDDAARQRARQRLLTAAKKYGIVPIGFITSQLQSETKPRAARLPTGVVTFLMTDIENSTALLHRLGDRYRKLLKDVRGIIQGAVLRAGGREIDVRADECFAVFRRARDAVEAAVAIQRALTRRRWPADLPVRLRAGIHSGRPTLTDLGYIGLVVHIVARVCAVAHGGQILSSAETATAAGWAAPVRFKALGRYRLPGIPDPLMLFQVEAEGLPSTFPRPRTKAVSGSRG